MGALFKIAFRNLTRQWKYSLAAFLSIVTGFLSLCLFRAYMVDIAHMYVESYQHRSMYGHFLIEKDTPSEDPWDRLLGIAEQQFIERWMSHHASEIKERVRFLRATGIVSNGTSGTLFIAKGYDVESGARLRGESWAWDTAAGEPLHITKRPTPIVIGKTLGSILECETKASRLYSKFGGYSAEIRPFTCPETRLQLNVTTPSGQANSIEGNVVGLIDGIFKEIDSKLINMNLGDMQRLFDTKALTHYTVELKDDTQVDRLMEDLRREARAIGLALRVIRWQDHKEGDIYVRTMELLSIFRNFVVSIMLAISGLSVFNTFLKIVNERTREIGTLRSLGYQKSDVSFLFLTEAGLLAVFGVIVGAALSTLSTWAINSAAILYKAGMLSEPVPFRIAYDFGVYSTSAVFLVVIAVVAAVGAVASTVRRPIHENLIHA